MPRPIPAVPVRPGLWAASLTLMSGGAAAQAVLLLLGPWLARLYTPADWGAYALFAAVVTNLAVIACARYEFALPLAVDDAEARDLLALCAWIGLGVTAACGVGVGVLFGVVAGQTSAGSHPPDASASTTKLMSSSLSLWLWLPLAVATTAAIQVLTLWATRAQRFGPLSAARVVQHAGGGVAQGVAGVVATTTTTAAGPVTLALAPIVATGIACGLLLRPAPRDGWGSLWRVTPAERRRVADIYRDFPWLNTPHAFLGALQDTVAIALIAFWTGDAAAGLWAFALRYLKAPATLVGGALSQALYPQLVALGPVEGLQVLRRTVAVLVLVAVGLGLFVAVLAPTVFAWAFGPDWASAGPLSQALAVYMAAHFVASPLGVVTLAWRAQAWALKITAFGQVVFLGTLALGLANGGLVTAAFAISIVMALFYGGYVATLVSGRLLPTATALPAGADNGERRN